MSADLKQRSDKRRSHIPPDPESGRNSQIGNALVEPTPKKNVRDSMIIPFPVSDDKNSDIKRTVRPGSVSTSGILPDVPAIGSGILKKPNEDLDRTTGFKSSTNKFTKPKALLEEIYTQKQLEEEILRQLELKAASLLKQEEIINNSGIPNKKELQNTFNNSKNKNSKIDVLKTLGPLSVKLESMRVSIEKRYEYMMHDLNQRLEALKKFFNNMINEVKGEAFNSIVNEKDQNLSNIKENLESILYKIRNSDELTDEDKEYNLAKERSFAEFFEFFDNFKEDCFNSIVSKASTINLENLKKQLLNFKSKNLENLLTAPKVFTSNLLRFFELESKQNKEKKPSEAKKFGDVLTSNQEISAEYFKFNRYDELYDPELNSKSKTPMICVINNKLLVVATRDKFRIVQYQYTSEVPKSRFYQQFNHEKGDRLNFIDVYCSSNIHYTENKAVAVEQNVSYHSVMAARCNDDSYHLLFGGNDCVVFLH